MPFFEPSPGQRIFYADPAPQNDLPVLLLHGLGVNSASWQLQIEPLAQAGFRPLVVDAPGFGQSGSSGGRWSIAGYAGLLAQLLASLGKAKAAVAGISMGGVHAQQFALDYPERVERLVLINTFAHLRAPSLSSAFYFLSRLALISTLGLERQAQAVARNLFPRPEQEELRRIVVQQVSEADPHTYRLAMFALGRFDSRRRLPGLRCPTLIVTAAEDHTILPAIQNELAGLIPGAVHTLVPDAGHAVIVDQPDLFNRILVEFLSASKGMK